MIQSRRAARIARRYAHALIDWRADVARGARIGETARQVDLPRMLRLDPLWVHTHVFMYNVHRQSRLFRAEINEHDFIERLRGL